ncbi:hypothetical protein V8E54_015022 [Elaphomyces granulatus]
MPIGPRMHDGEEGFLVITPLERGGGESTVLVSRGWIPKKMRNQKHNLPEDDVVVEGLLREPFKKNIYPGEQAQRREVLLSRCGGDGIIDRQPAWIEEIMGKISFPLSHVDIYAGTYPSSAIAKTANSRKTTDPDSVFKPYGRASPAEPPKERNSVPKCKPDITYVDGFLNIENYERESFFIESGVGTYRNGLVDLQAVNPDIKKSFSTILLILVCGPPRCVSDGRDLIQNF